MKKNWIALCMIVFILSAFLALWMERPVLMQKMTDTVTTTINDKLNGTMVFSGMDISLTGCVTLSDPVVKDNQGRIVLTGQEILVHVNPWKALQALGDAKLMTAVDSIDAEKPVLHIWENKSDNTWNIASLVKPSTDKTDSGFRAAVRIHSGAVRAALADGTVIVGSDCSGSADFSSYPEVAVTADMMVDQKRLTASGRYTSSRNFNVIVNGEAVKAVYASGFLPDSVDVALHDGDVTNIKVRVSQSQQGLTLSGQADIEHGSVTAYGYDIEGLQGHVDVSTDDITLTDVEGAVNGQSFKADGIIKTNTLTPVFNLHIKAPHIELSALPQLSLPVSGTIGIQGTIWGTVDDISGKGTVTVPSLNYDGMTITDGSIDLSYVDHIINIESASGHAADGMITASGDYNTDTGEYAVQAQAQQVRLEQLPKMPAAVLGSVSATIQAEGNANTNLIAAKGRASASGLSYNGIEADQADFDFAYDSDVVTVMNLKASVAGGTIQGGGTYNIETNVPDISFTAEKLPMDMFSSYISVPMSGTVSAAGHITGASLTWDLLVNASSGSVKGMPFDSIDGTLRGTGGHIDIPALYWRYVDGQHTVKGSIDLDRRMIDLNINTDHMRIERLLPAAGKEDIPLTGWIDNRVTLSGSLDNPSADGSFHLTKGSYSGYLYKSISADYHLDNGTVYISNGDISSYNASLSVHGSVGQTLDLYINGNQLDIARIMPSNKLPRSGLIDINAHVGGTMDSPTAFGSLNAAALNINHMALTEIHGDFGYYDGIIRLTDLRLKQNGGAYDGNILFNTANQRIMGRASVSSGDIAGILQIVGAPVQNISGRIDGNIVVDGTTDNPRAGITGQITQAVLDGQAFEPADIDAQFEDGVVKINKLALETGDSLLAAKGTYALHGPVHMQVAARNFPARILTSVFGMEKAVVDAPIDFAAELSGTGDDLTADISAQLNGGMINGVTFTSAYGLANVHDGIIHVNQAYISRDSYKASASGTIPVSALSGGRTEESMDVTLKLDHAGLDALTFLTPLVKSAQGGIEGDLKLTGTLAAPVLKGSLGVQNGIIQFQKVRYPLNNVNGTLHFNGSDMTISVSGTMDKKGKKNPGSVSIQADAGWDGRQLSHYDGTIDMDHLLIDCDYFKGPLTGHLALSKGDYAPKISGIAEISDTVLDIPLALTSASEPPDVELDFTVSLGEKVRLYNPVLYDLMINGSANFKGTAAHPRPSGRFEASRGTIHYLDTNFKISKAKADFSLMDSFLPVMDVEGQTRIGQYSVLLTLRGPADNMNMILRSNPPLTKPQIVSLITLRNSGKQQSSSLNEEDVDKLIGSGIRMTLNSMGITQELEKVLSLDMLTVTNGSLNLNDKNTDINQNYYNIEMGKYLFTDFMVTAAFGLNHDDNRFGAQYDLSSKFSLNAWKSDESSFIGGSYKYSFY